DGELDVINPGWEEKHCVSVVLASEGYPENPQTGKEISGLDRLEDVLPFFSGVAEKEGRYYTAGGRVVGLTAVDADFDKALNKAYAAAEKVNFEGKQYRKDIGYRLMAKTKVAK
ncbi:MAG: phosphoribosylglycinamide synthetase C domain-containing protein, partial [Limisphaerales bacterium]